MIIRQSVEKFLSSVAGIPVLDVRSPCEFLQGHIPGAISFPLFSDEERKVVGTLYKQVGPQEALLQGLEFVGPKLAGFVKMAITLAPNKKVGVHCWRGGSRSSSMAILLETAGFEVILLAGGYKAFRQAVLNEDIYNRKMVVLGGLTGTGKTHILHHLNAFGHQVLDLEKLASHKGSVFGAIDQPPQPSQEHFENEIFHALFHSEKDRPIWIEDESKAIGRLRVPEALFLKMRSAPVIFIEKTKQSRLQFIEESYGNASVVDLEQMVGKIAKRLGGLRLKTALEAIRGGEMQKAAEVVLEYYDAGYLHGLKKREPGTYQMVTVGERSDAEMAVFLAEMVQGFFL